MKTRINFLDNLRTFLIFLVIVLHAGIVYESILEEVWIVSDPDKISSLGLVRMYLDIFVMFTMFFISGYFIPNSLKGKNVLGFLASKFERIMLPWIVAVFTLIPAYKIIFLYSRGLPQEEWFSYFHFFDRTGGSLGNFADNPTQSWLWFLPVLFLFQVLYMILAKTKVLSIRISLKNGVILTFAIGILYSMIISNLGLTGWYHSPILHFQNERLLIYFMVFLLGSLCNKLKVFENTPKNKKLYIWSNISLTLSLGIFTVVALNLFFNMIESGRNFYFVSEMIDRVMYHSSLLISMFSFLYILIHVFRFNINYTNSILSELSKNSYAVYITHLLVIGLVALVLVNIAIPVLLKYFILITLTFVISNYFVYGYRMVFKNTFSYKTISIAIPVAAILLTVFIYVKAESSEKPIKQTTELHPDTIIPTKSIHAAAVEGDLGAIEQHIKAGSDLDAKEPASGSSPLMTATVFSKTEVVFALINAGADVNFRNNEGSTPLHTAAFFCRTNIVQALLDNGADKSIKNNAGSTPLELVIAPFELMKGYYDYFSNTLGPLGLELDYELIKSTRPIIAEILKSNSLE